MKTIYLHGSAAQFGDKFELDIKTPREALHALAVQIEGFRSMVRDGEWFMFRGPLENEADDDEESIDLALGDVDEIHLMPAIRGAGGGNGGMFSIILGIVAIVAAPFTGGASLAMYAAGAGLIVGGLIQMTMKVPGVSDTSNSTADSKASFLFQGPRNQSTQGVAVPRGYGRIRTGSIVISAGLYAERIL
jgi:predicted phage tail protein